MSDMNEKVEEPQEQPSDRAPMPDEELQKILEAHRMWVESEVKEGERADLSQGNLRQRNLEAAQLSKANLHRANLEEAKLTEANLQEAFLVEANLKDAFLGKADLQGAHLLDANLKEAYLLEANLQGAVLCRANLEGAALGGANLQQADLIDANLEGAYLLEASLNQATLTKVKLSGANLTRTILREADLQDADLTGATGLSAGQLAGVNVSGAKLPPEIHKFEALTTVEETSKNARKPFVYMLLGCLYCMLTIATTTDVRLLTNSATSPLPIIGATIPIVGFYWAAPLLLLGLYVYFHFYLQNLWESMAPLPAVLPDGSPLDKRAYPWLLNGLVRDYMVRLKDYRPLMSRLQNVVSKLLAFWAVPGTLLLFWLRYLRRHDWIGTGLHILLLTVSIGTAIMLQRLAAVTFRGEGRESFQWREAAKKPSTYKRSAVFVAIGVLFSLLSFGAIEGVPPGFVSGLTADLKEVDVSIKPTNWTGKKEEIALVKGARLKGANLRYAQVDNAFLVKADLRGAGLQGAILIGAKLQEANLHTANLQGAILIGAKLQEANLHTANLQGANLRGANLQGAILRGAKLQEAHLFVANLQGAILNGAELQEADLHTANLQGANLQGANLQGAILHWAKLQEALLVQANLQKADLVGANLQKAYLVGAKLQGADLLGANLQEARLFRAEGLTASEVKRAKNWELAFYSDDLLKELGLPPDHNETVKKKLAELEKEKKAAGGK